jgi:hypothetical protein
MNEHSFIRALHKKLPKSVVTWKINDAYQGGVPDALYMANKTLWVEYKYIKQLPKKPTTIIRHSLTPQQAMWLERLNAADCCAALVIGCQKKCFIVKSAFSDPITTATYIQNSVSLDAYTEWLVEQTTGA